MIRWKYRGLFLLALTAAAAGCAGCNDDIPNTPAVIPPTLITEPTFAGTLTVNGAATQPFAVNRSGNVDILINALADSNGPAAVGSEGTIRVGLLLGTWNGTVCSTQLSNDNAFVATQITGAVTATGGAPLCARIYDVGKLTEAVAFEVIIKHF